MRLASVLAVTACGGGGAAPTTTVTLAVDGTPELVAYQDGDGAWQRPPLYDVQGNWSIYNLDVTGPYVALVSCQLSDGARYSEQILAVPPEAVGVALAPYPCGPAPPPGVTAEITGQMLQTGSVYVGGIGATSGSAPWTFDLGVPPGIADVIAVGGGSVAIRRNQAITRTAAEPVIDVVNEGAPLDLTMINVFGLLPFQLIVVGEFLQTANGFADLRGTTESSAPTMDLTLPLILVPAKLLADGDVQGVFLHQFAGSNLMRSYDVSLAASFDHVDLTDPVTVAMPPLISDVMLDDLKTTPGFTATWDPLDNYSAVAVELDSGCVEPELGRPVTSLRIHATRPWLDAHGVRSVTFASDAPGFDPAWMVDLGEAYSRSFTVENDTRHAPIWLQTASTVSEDVFPTPRAAICAGPIRPRALRTADHPSASPTRWNAHIAATIAPTNTSDAVAPLTIDTIAGPGQ